MARTSAYGELLQSSVPKVALPSWVTNAGYGDLTKELAAGDIAREQADQQRLKTIAMQDEQDRLAEQQAYEDALATTLKDRQPRNMREAYKMAAEEAMSRGMPDDWMKMQKQLEAIDEQEKTRKRQSIQEAINLGKTNPDYAQKMLDEAGLPGSEIFSDDAKKMLRTKGSGRNAMYYDPETDSYVPVLPRTEKTKERKFDYIYNYYTAEARKIEKGTEGEYGPEWSTTKPTPEQIKERKAQLESDQADAKAAEEKARNAREPSFLQRLVGTREARAPTATPMADRPRGDSQRGGPQVGDEVAIIKRKRSVSRD